MDTPGLEPPKASAQRPAPPREPRFSALRALPFAILILLYLCVTLAPLALAWAGARPPRPVLDELASGAGMLAFAIILVEFVLSGRFETISRRIGMDVTMRFHQLLARSALALALVHPFLYRSPFNPPYPWDPTRQLTLTGDLEHLATGIAAWVALPAFVLVAIARDRLRIGYETWRLLHGLGAAAIAALILHHALAAGRYSADPALAGLWLVLFAAAMLSLVWVYGVEPLRQKRRPWRVAGVRPAGERVWELTLAPDGHAGLRYEAGQFVWLNIGRTPFTLHENPFSLSSAPAGGADLTFVIKELGDLTRTIGQVAPGTRCFVDGPHGNLVIGGRAEPGIALIGAGVGVAPLLGILRQLRATSDPRPTLLVHGNRTEGRIACRAEIEALQSAPGAELALVLSEPPEGWRGRRGRIDAALIRELMQARPMQDWLFVLCGPPAMMAAVEETLIALGVASSRILSERFTYD